MNAEDVIRSCFAVNDSYAEHVTVDALAALCAACGGGPVVILEDGTLATAKRESDETEAGCVSLRWSVVPVGEPS